MFRHLARRLEATGRTRPSTLAELRSPENHAALDEITVAALGARVITVRGSYDDALGEAIDAAAANGWDLISDTSDRADETIVADVMAGYRDSTFRFRTRRCASSSR